MEKFKQVMEGKWTEEKIEREIEIEDIFGKKHKIKEGVIFFKRYAGCIFCQTHIWEILKNQDKIPTKIFLVFDSQKEVVKEFYEKIRNRINEDKIFFVGNPKLHKEFGIGKGKLLSFNTLKKTLSFLLKPKYIFLKNGLKGRRNQAPGCVIIKNGKIIKYVGKDIADNPNIEEVIKII